MARQIVLCTFDREMRMAGEGQITRESAMIGTQLRGEYLIGKRTTYGGTTPVRKDRSLS